MGLSMKRIRIVADVYEKLKGRAEEKNMDVTEYVSSLVPSTQKAEN